jgi:hypothetical protein
MVNIPLRYDRAINLQINLEIQDFNTNLSKRAKLFKHVDLVEMKFNRKYFTRHGLHLNNVSKEGLAKAIALQINKIIKCSSNDKSVFPPQWKDECINKSIIVNTTHSSNWKPAVDNLSKVESPLNQIHDSQ